jgi:hypothetical protein
MQAVRCATLPSRMTSQNGTRPADESGVAIVVIEYIYSLDPPRLQHFALLVIWSTLSQLLHVSNFWPVGDLDKGQEPAMSRGLASTALKMGKVDDSAAGQQLACDAIQARNLYTRSNTL